MYQVASAATLVLKLIGKDYVDPVVVNNIKRLEWGDSIFGIYLALNGPLEYKSGNDIGKSAQLHISDVTLDYISKIFYECRSGKLPGSPLPIMANSLVSLYRMLLTGISLTLQLVWPEQS
jgi:hypothetical protein